MIEKEILLSDFTVIVSQPKDPYRFQKASGKVFWE